MMQAGRSGVTNLQSALKMYDFLENILYLHMYNEYINKSQHNNVNSYFASIAYNYTSPIVHIQYYYNKLFNGFFACLVHGNNC